MLGISAIGEAVRPTADRSPRKLVKRWYSDFSGEGYPVHIRKAVITAAGPGQDRLPLQRFVDLDGVEKTALQIILEEVLAAGVEQVCLVVRGGSQQAYREAAGEQARTLVFVEQPAARGYGEALYRAAAFVGDQPFLHLVSDHLYVSRQPRRCAEQLIEVARAEECSVSAVQPTRESVLRYFGAIGGAPVAGRPGLYQIERVMEKPTPTRAEQHLIVPGLRAGHYLCFFGMHVLTPCVMDLLGAEVARGGRPTATAPAGPDGPQGAACEGGSSRAAQSGAGHAGPIMLSPALEKLAQRERYLALEVDGTRYNIAVKYGMLMAQLGLVLSGSDREEILTRLVELLAAR
jgi:UTP--glucose-1-phosphate uridylyltransferase